MPSNCVEQEVALSPASPEDPAPKASLEATSTMLTFGAVFSGSTPSHTLDPSHQSSPHHILPRKTNELPASRRFYDTLDLRIMVWKMLKITVLARLMRLEKAVTGSVAELLYYKVNIRRMYSMKRSNPRHATCQNAVRILDLSPLPIATFERLGRVGAPRPLLLPDFDNWLGTFPNLRTIIHRYPFDERDHGILFSKWELDGIPHHYLEVESRFQINILRDRLSSSWQPALPKIDITLLPLNTKMRHTIALKTVGETRAGSWDSLPGPIGGYDWDTTSLNEWRAWLYKNSKLDRRITSISIEDDCKWVLSTNMPRTTFGDIHAFIQHRSNRQCEPLKEIRIPSSSRHHSIEVYLSLFAHIGPDLRILHIDLSIQFNIYDLWILFIVIDRAFPKLQILSISDGAARSFTSEFEYLRGLRRLRRLIFHSSFSLLEPGESLHRVGSADCVYVLAFPFPVGLPMDIIADWVDVSLEFNEAVQRKKYPL